MAVALVAWSFLKPQPTPNGRRFFFSAATPNQVRRPRHHRGEFSIALREREAQGKVLDTPPAAFS
jgi:hypothetical protein